MIALALLSYRNLRLAFGGPLLLEDAGLSIRKRDRICLIGRNGEGKSSLLRVLAGEHAPDQGEREAIPELRVAKLDQEGDSSIKGTVFEVVAEGLGSASQQVSEYHRLAQQYAEDPENKDLAAQLDHLQSELDASNGWQLEHKVEGLADQVDLKADARYEQLSGGDKRRALLARSLASDPHILLLDEPTNHLDIPAIRWLEEFLRKSEVALLFVSHDRSFIRRAANRILDLDRGQLTSWDCGYDEYLERKAQQLETEAQRQEVFDKKLAAEEVWIRKGIQARRTRNQGRVRNLRKMREARSERRNVSGAAKLDLNTGELSGRKVITADQVTCHRGNTPVIKNFSTTIWRGDRVGIVGLNGSGKTTLLNLLLKELEPDSGSVTHGTKLETAYFDQHRAQLDENLSVAENVSPYGETVTLNGTDRHILSYLRDFLFTPQAARAPIHKLSGGERARLLLARLFLKPANLLVFDEPTNDLDIETVELLEERLHEFNGTLLLVSHDRSFLDNTVTHTLALEGDGTVKEYTGGSDAWLAEREAHKKTDSSRTSRKPPANTPKQKSRKLSNKERQALAELPGIIERLEQEHAALSARMAKPEYYRDPSNAPSADTERLSQLETGILEAYEQWEALTQKSESA
ncbi:MAG: ATP-binding cassette domain-containing protein [Opitutales bacterium]